jgi:hypothetical protein
MTKRKTDLVSISGRAALDAGMCVNGCERPIAPPSKVICAECQKRISEKLAAMLARMERKP